MARFRLYAAVFICGAAVMAYEVTGSRLMAPVVGTSIIAWTALIGTILAALSAGYWYGGIAADRAPRASRLAGIIALAALAVALTAVFAPAVTAAVSASGWGIRASAVSAALLLFAPAAFLLGMVSPYAAKLATHDLTHNGAAVGSLAALSTLGSIAGTFLAGFVLLGHLGSTATLAALSLALALAALMVSTARKPVMASVWALALALSVAHLAVPPREQLQRSGAAVLDTAFQRVIVSDGIHRPTGRPVRTLATDPFGTQASVFRDGSEPVYGYIRAFRWGEAFSGPPARALVLGGAAYMWPREYLLRYPDARLTVVEIDEGVTRIAREYFGLTDDPRMTIVHDDGRRFLNGTVGPYDHIYLDAFTNIIIPFHLVTEEFVRRTDAALSPRGVVMANLIGSFSGEGSELIGSIARTFGEVFSQVVLVRISDAPPAQAQNIMLIASHEPLDAGLAALGMSAEAAPDGSVFTDDFAPVEVLAAGLLRRY